MKRRPVRTYTKAQRKASRFRNDHRGERAEYERTRRETGRVPFSFHRSHGHRVGARRVRGRRRRTLGERRRSAGR